MGTIDLQTPPTPASPATTNDYNYQNAILQLFINNIISKPLLLTNFENLLKPRIANGNNINHGGARYLVNGDTDISGTPADGRAYIKLTESGTQLLPSFVNSAAGFSWNYIYNGFYDASENQLLPYVLVKIGTNYYKYDLKNSDNKFDLTAKINVITFINLGLWNMDTTASKTYSLPALFNIIYSTVTMQDIFDFIPSIDIKIRNDANLIYSVDGTSGNAAYYYINITTRQIIISRITGGFFDSIDFDDPTIDRGVISFHIKI